MNRRIPTQIGLIIAASLMGGCAGARPSDAPAEMTPAAATSTTATASALIRGFTSAEKAALRIRNVGCGTVVKGSGFAVSDHMLVTNRHVAAGADRLDVSGFDGRDYQVTTSGSTTIADLAIIRTVEALPATIPLAGANPEHDIPVTAVGFPQGGPLKSTIGHTRGYGPDPIGWTTIPMLIHDAPLEPGSSGGALLNAAGELVGVNYAKDYRQANNYAVPVDVLRKALDSPGQFVPFGCDEEPLRVQPQRALERCSATVSVGAATSCPFALNVEQAWRTFGRGSISVQAYSPVTGQTYAADCIDGRPVVCTGSAGFSVFIDP